MPDLLERFDDLAADIRDQVERSPVRDVVLARMAEAGRQLRRAIEGWDDPA